jgi:hypothetical protein
MGWTSRTYEAAAQAWLDSGGGDPPANAWTTMVLGCWLGSPGARADGVSPTLERYARACRHVLEVRNDDWLDDLFDGKEYCSLCGQSWRSENCGICTACAKAFPPCCPEQRGFLEMPNGNRGCPSCSRGEVVG